LGKESFSLEYKTGSAIILINKARAENFNLTLEYSRHYKEIIQTLKDKINEYNKKENKELSYPTFFFRIREELYREVSTIIGTIGIYNQIFIPAGRSFISNLKK